MKYRTREEVVRGDSPYVDVKVSGDGVEAKVVVQYCRTSVAKDTTTTTFGKLDLGVLTPEDLACVGRTVARTLNEMKRNHAEYLSELQGGIMERL